MDKTFVEGNLLFDFSVFQTADRFDDIHMNAAGMKAVDFIAEDADSVYFIEVKDYQHPSATMERRRSDYETLISSINDKKAAFPIEMGMKIKDSLLRKYSSGDTFIKKVIYLLVMNNDKLGEYERGLLMTKIYGYVPTGLSENRFPAFTSISFDLVSTQQLKSYGIICTAKTKE